MRLTTSNSPSDTIRRFTIGLFIFIFSFYFVAYFTNSDFLQDYGSAWAWWHGLPIHSATSTTLPQCCPHEKLSADITQTAHPPIITLLILPLALLPFRLASLLWFLISWFLLIIGWEILKIPPKTCLAISILAVIGLSLGNLEPLIFFLLAFFLSKQKEKPIISAIILGLATAIKVYPGLFILGLWVIHQRKSAIIANASACTIIGVAEAIFGIGTTSTWLAYSQVNTLRFITSFQNISITHWMYLLLPSVLPNIIFLSLSLILFAVYLNYIQKTGDLSPIASIIILTSPISWPHYTIIRPNINYTIEKLIIFATSIIMITTRWLTFLPDNQITRLIYPIMTLSLVYSYVQTLVAHKLNVSVPAK